MVDIWLLWLNDNKYVQIIIGMEFREKLTRKNSSRLRRAEKRIREWSFWAVLAGGVIVWMAISLPSMTTILLGGVLFLAGIAVLTHILWAIDATKKGTLEKEVGCYYFFKIHKNAIAFLWILLLFCGLLALGIVLNA